MKKAAFFQDKNKKLLVYSLNGPVDGVNTGDLAPLKPNNNDEAATEKHVPVLSYEGDTLTVRVGDVPHPMLPEHYIEWIMVLTKAGGIFRYLNPGDEPMAKFQVKEEDVLGVYEYCNLHSLWEADTASYRFTQTACSPEFPEGCID